MSDPLYLLTVEDGVALVTLNRPQAMNSINRELRLQLLELFPLLDLRDDVNVIVLTGAGDKAFSAGADLVTAMQEGQQPGSTAGCVCVCGGGDTLAGVRH